MILRPFAPLLFALLSVSGVQAATTVPLSGNPIIPGWYADPDAHVFGDRYWIFTVVRWARATATTGSSASTSSASMRKA